MNREEWFNHKWCYLKRFSWMAAGAFLFGVLAQVLNIQILAVGLVLLVPLIFWLVLVPLLHWKDRYIGERSTLWGAVLLIETSGWSKIVYWFRHVLPDWKRKGRYEDLE